MADLLLRSLLERGLSGVCLVVSDAHAGLSAARQAVFGSVPWQRCQFHLQQNAQAYVPRQEMKTTVAAGIRTIFNAPDRATADTSLREMVTLYQSSAPRIAAWMEANLPEGLTVFCLPEAHRRLLRTSNGLERVKMEISDEWETGKAYLTFERKD